MRLLDRHILRELLGPFLFGVAAFTSLMFAGNELFKVTELLAEYHAPVIKAVELVLLRMPSIVVMTLPMAMLLAALLGFGRLSGDSEVIALFAGGVSLYRVAMPVILLAMITTGLSFALNEIVAPQTFAEHEKIRRELMDEPLGSTKPFFGTDSEDGEVKTVFFVKGGFDPSTKSLRDAVVVRYLDNEPVALVYGRHAVWKGGNEWGFSDGYFQGLGSARTGIIRFGKSQIQEVKINKTPDQLALYQRKPEELSFKELRNYISMLEDQGMDVNEYRVKLYQKISLPFACLVFALIGTPLGLRPHRSSSAMGLGLAIMIIFGYWILLHYMTILGNNGTVSPAAANFIPALVGASIGIGLIAKAAK